MKQPSQIASTTDVSIPHDCADVICISTDATTLRGRPYSNIAFKWDPMTVCYRRQSNFLTHVVPSCLCSLFRMHFLIFRGFWVHPQRKAFPNDVCYFPRSLQADAGMLPQIRPRPLPSTSFPIHYYGLSYHSTLYELSYWQSL